MSADLIKLKIDIFFTGQMVEAEENKAAAGEDALADELAAFADDMDAFDGLGNDPQPAATANPMAAAVG